MNEWYSLDASVMPGTTYAPSYLIFVPDGGGIQIVILPSMFGKRHIRAVEACATQDSLFSDSGTNSSNSTLF